MGNKRRGNKHNKKAGQRQIHQFNRYGGSPGLKGGRAYTPMPKQKISDAQRLRMEEERKRKLEMEAKFKCDIDEMADTEVEKLMVGRDVYLKN